MVLGAQVEKVRGLIGVPPASCQQLYQRMIPHDSKRLCLKTIPNRTCAPTLAGGQSNPPLPADRATEFETQLLQSVMWLWESGTTGHQTDLSRHGPPPRPTSNGVPGDAARGRSIPPHHPWGSVPVKSRGPRSFFALVTSGLGIRANSGFPCQHHREHAIPTHQRSHEAVLVNRPVAVQKGCLYKNIQKCWSKGSQPNPTPHPANLATN